MSVAILMTNTTCIAFFTSKIVFVFSLLSPYVQWHHENKMKPNSQFKYTIHPSFGESYQKSNNVPKEGIVPMSNWVSYS